jgi:hypothetical protein
MEPFPFRPVRAQKRVELEPSAFESSGDRYSRRLLPAAAGFAIFENFIPADQAFEAGGIEVENPPLRFRLEHDARVADSAPGDGDRAVRHLVVDDAVLSNIGSRVRLSDASARDPNQHIVAEKESGLRSRNELRMTDGGMRHLGRSCILGRG